MANRGLYGEAEGNENRNGSATFADRLLDNDLVEGEITDKWNRLWKAGNKSGNYQPLADDMEQVRAAWLKVPGVLRDDVEKRIRSMYDRSACRNYRPCVLC